MFAYCCYQGRRKKEEGRRKKEEGRRKKEEGPSTPLAEPLQEEGRSYPPLPPPRGEIQEEVAPPRGEIQEEGRKKLTIPMPDASCSMPKTN
ncbi:MAG: hypothetical protein EAZ68_03770 [Oscillatoriales cyanobacterium]|nr:MAG: hypothetical protein EAZ68_03770 [Oscillatoriales cyanobacterium]